MSDDEIRRHVDAVVPAMSDIDTEAALTRTRAAARIRARRRRLVLRVAPLGVAAATVAIVLLASLGPLKGSGTSTSHRPKPTATTATTAWFRHVVGVASTASGSVDLGSVWVVRLTDPNHGSFDVRPSDRFGAGTLTYDGSRGGWVVDVLGKYCAGKSAIYRVDRSGDSLTFSVVSDDCELRRNVLDSTVFSPLTSPDQLTG